MDIQARELRGVVKEQAGVVDCVETKPSLRDLLCELTFYAATAIPETIFPDNEIHVIALCGTELLQLFLPSRAMRKFQMVPMCLISIRAETATSIITVKIYPSADDASDLIKHLSFYLDLYIIMIPFQYKMALVLGNILHGFSKFSVKTRNLLVEKTR